MIKLSNQRRKHSRTLSSKSTKVAKQAVLRSLAPRSKQKERRKDDLDDEALVDQELSRLPNHLSGLLQSLDSIDLHSIKDEPVCEIRTRLDRYISENLKRDRRSIGLIYRPKLDCFCLMINEHLYWLLRLSSINMKSRHPEFLFNWIATSYSKLDFFLHAPSNKWGGLVFRKSESDGCKESLIFSTLFPLPDASLMRAYCSIECESVDGRTQLQLSYNKGRPDSPIIRLDGIGDVTKQMGRPAVCDAVGTPATADNWIIVESCSKHKVYSPGRAPPA